MTDVGTPELLVIAATKAWACASCAAESGRGGLLTMDDAGPLCLDCADLGHLEYLPRGDAALTRRAKRASRLSAVVVQWSRARKRYERQGILVEAGALAAVEADCLADVEARERRREREDARRVVEDEGFVAELAEAVLAQFPGCPAKRAERIARHAASRGSGRIGRTSAGRALDPDTVRLAVVAAVRHEDTRYEDLLMSGVTREEARGLVRDEADQVLQGWRAGLAQAGSDRAPAG